MRSVRVILCVFLFLVLPLSPSFAGLINFDGMSAGDLVTTIDGVTFSSNVSGFDLVVSTGFDTTSMSNYLGVNDSESSDQFFGGDEIYLNFAEAATSISASFIFVGTGGAGAFSIIVGDEEVLSPALEDSILPDGGYVYTLLFESLTPFYSATLSSSALGFNTFNIDDVNIVTSSVPIPQTLFLFAAGLLGLSAAGRRKN